MSKIGRIVDVFFGYVFFVGIGRWEVFWFGIEGVVEIYEFSVVVRLFF